MSILDDPYIYILQKCSDNGISMTKLCKKLKISRASLDRWATTPPKSIRILNQIDQFFQDLEKKNAAP
jgi:hypothetical protein